jgi:hypothetical protein
MIDVASRIIFSSIILFSLSSAPDRYQRRLLQSNLYLGGGGGGTSLPTTNTTTTTTTTTTITITRATPLADD